MEIKRVRNETQGVSRDCPLLPLPVQLVSPFYRCASAKGLTNYCGWQSIKWQLVRVFAEKFIGGLEDQIPLTNSKLPISHMKVSSPVCTCD